MENRRYYGLDALRGCMMMLGIVLHSATFYLVQVPPGMPIPTDRNHAFLFDLVFRFIHSFRMPAFFVMAGLFTSLMIQNRGVWGTYKNRALRILAPLLVSIVTVLPPAGFFAISFMLSARFGTHHFLPDPMELRILGKELIAAGAPVGRFPLWHLWFLYFLCLFYLLIPVCRWLAWGSHLVEGALRTFLKSPGVWMLFGLISAATLWPFRGAEVFPSPFLELHPPSLIYYGFFFMSGSLFHTYPEAMQASQHQIPLFTVNSLILFPLTLITTRFDLATGGSAGFPHLMAVLSHGLCTWSLIFLSIGITMRYFNHESAWTQYISRSSYWVFLMHLPMVAFAGWWMVQYNLPAILKFICVSSFTTVACFMTYHYLVQRTWISVFLNGRRFSSNWPWQRPLDSSRAGQ